MGAVQLMAPRVQWIRKPFLWGQYSLRLSNNVLFLLGVWGEAHNQIVMS